MDVVAGLVQEDLEVADNGVGPLPAPPNSAHFGDLDPTLARRPNAMMDVDAKGQFGWIGREDVTTAQVRMYQKKTRVLETG